MISDNKHFLKEELFLSCMELSEWDVRNYKMHNGLVLLKPDFYPEGYILAYSKKAIIICDGSSVINYRGSVFTDTESLVKKYGEKILSEHQTWDYKQEKEWLIKRLNGDWVDTFSKLSELKHRKKLRC
tara:strand:+ start:1671 stop:2054 length:384 start_codon:yes stop_codon:yes gene_type:complete